jgi:hypothetical protein
MQVPCPFCALASENAVVDGDEYCIVKVGKESSTVFLYKSHSPSWREPLLHIALWALQTQKLKIKKVLHQDNSDCEFAVYRKDKETFYIRFITKDKNAKCSCAKKN